MSTAATVRRAVLFSALEQIAKHHTSRDLLVDDSKTKVDLTIKGYVKTLEVQESFTGHLIGIPLAMSDFPMVRNPATNARSVKVAKPKTKPKAARSKSATPIVEAPPSTCPKCGNTKRTDYSNTSPNRLQWHSRGPRVYARFEHPPGDTQFLLAQRVVSGSGQHGSAVWAERYAPDPTGVSVERAETFHVMDFSCTKNQQIA